jgi:hypothetical protein
MKECLYDVLASGLAAIPIGKEEERKKRWGLSTFLEFVINDGECDND